ncbi:RNA polymerase-binding protein DksA [Arcobacter sp. YIC-80]|uniref:RNA polymerase-binding protein DksA n=1 Tax=unclassified Arcobacter TaxID=2593671 RepID=UPI00384A8659
MPNTKQIEELRIALENRKEKILENIDGSKENIQSLKSQEVNDDLDYAELASDSFTEGAIANHQIDELKQIEDALKRIKTGEYGKCDMCSVVIPIGRLKAKPFARYCTECREVYENEQLRKSS